MAWDLSTLLVEWSAFYRSVAMEYIIIDGVCYSVVTVDVTKWMVTMLIGILSIPQLQLSISTCYADRHVAIQLY